MLKLIIKAVVRLRFFCTRKANASAAIRKALQHYQNLGRQIDEQGRGRQSFRVPLMRGVDEDMREWSFYMILEHNVIVNRFMKITVESLAQHKIPKALQRVDTKKDVMPSANPGPEQMQLFTDSVERYLARIENLDGLRSTPRFRHPIFGMLNAHGWHCMMALHLQIHLPQANCVVEGSNQR